MFGPYDRRRLPSRPLDRHGPGYHRRECATEIDHALRCNCGDLDNRDRNAGRAVPTRGPR